MTDDSLHKPVFVFSAGWRSGSTMIQRLIASSYEIMMWGEAGGALDSFEDALVRYEQMLGAGGKRFRHGFGGNGADQYEAFIKAGKEGENKWIACMNPGLEHIKQSLRELLYAIYARPAMEDGYGRWGVKEVQSGLGAAVFLRELFPEAKFVFLVRNPYDAMLSIKRRNWMDMAGERDPLGFYMHHWSRLALEFKQVDFGFHVKYEDIISNAGVVDEMVRYLELENIDNSFTARSRADWKASNAQQLSLYERMRIRKACGEAISRYGY